MIYLDNSATTRVSKQAAMAAMHYMTDEYYNPSSMYAPAVAVEREVERVRARMAQSLGAESAELYFTSGGTESDNIAVMGVAAALRRGTHRFITTEMEHPAIYEVFNALEKAGQEVVRIRPDRFGGIDPFEVADAVDEKTALVSVMHVNNEFGSVADMAEICSAVRAKNPNTLVHSDGVQAYCKLRETRVPVDLYSISAHKMHGPKGVGALLMRKHVKNAGGQLGGGQEKGFRSGTTNTPGIIGMGVAMAEAQNELAQAEQYMRRLKQTLASYLLSIPDTVVNGPRPDMGAAHILSIAFFGVRGEVLLHALEAKGILVSTGSACSAKKKGKNRVLASIGVEGEQAEGTIRFSLSAENTGREMEITADITAQIVRELRRFKRR